MTSAKPAGCRARSSSCPECHRRRRHCRMPHYPPRAAIPNRNPSPGWAGHRVRRPSAAVLPAGGSTVTAAQEWEGPDDRGGGESQQDCALDRLQRPEVGLGVVTDPDAAGLTGEVPVVPAARVPVECGPERGAEQDEGCPHDPDRCDGRGCVSRRIQAAKSTNAGRTRSTPATGTASLASSQRAGLTDWVHWSR